ncbi:cyclic nucleotide-binding/CBS domain-containing protein [Haliangium ochraceum]|uniref:Putative signal transduction protein with CBS domains n=1 Tax=Haliangium ochraceum (strain DSM 14365 / JCM 11303 / SMP-2) TaxID=502025 RepID=D0LSG2_HALO1|nr:CBS domain-containing protein [Haliangium ochraceum]ACY15661.1 putative signal transduction protein with CBS domains [Haliangium ochraceum DSM 14365]
MRSIQKPIKDFLSDEPLAAVAPDDPVTAAIAAMKKSKWDCALVLDGDTLVGIFTERDFLYRVSAAQADPAATKVRDVMTAEPETLRPQDSIAYAINRMVVRGFRNVPIVDDDGKAVAVLDVRDVMTHLDVVFKEVQETQIVEKEWDEWTDIGGGA